MAIPLKKGATVNLKKEFPNLNRILVKLEWDPIKKFLGLGPDMDINAGVICIDRNGIEDNIVYKYNTRGYGGAIIHLNDEGDRNNKQIEIFLNELPDRISRLSIIINIDAAYSRHQDFSKVKNCLVHVTELNTEKELVRYKVDGNYKGTTGIFVADIYRDNNDWKFLALGDGVRVCSINEMARLIRE